MAKRVWFVILTLLILIAACEGGTSGSVTRSRRRCSANSSGGRCTGSYGTLRGTYSEDVESTRIFLNTPVHVEVTASAEEGRVKVYVRSPEDKITSVEASPGKPASLEGIAKGQGEEFRVYFEAVDGEASGVSFEIVYELR
jgi:hypothetical protein